MSVTYMKDMFNNTNDGRFRYRRPELKAIPFTMQSFLCQSEGNDSMREYDYGDAGFDEV